MPIEIKPAVLTGVKGYTPRPAVPSAASIQKALPSLYKMATWPEYQMESSWMGLDRPGYIGELPSPEQYAYTKFAQTRIGMGVKTPPPSSIGSIPTYVRGSRPGTVAPSVAPSTTAFGIPGGLVVGSSVARPARMDYANDPGYLRFGSTEITAVNPLRSLSNLSGQFLGQDPALVGPGGPAADPFSWFAERGIDMANAPTRLIDYAWSLPATLVAKALGFNLGSPINRTPTGAPEYPFQGDPIYWANLKNWLGSGRPPTDEELERLAWEEASLYSRYPQQLGASLYAQFRKDRDAAQGLTSGNDRIDYMAKKELEAALSVIDAGATGTIDLGPLKLANDPVAAVVQFINAGGITARSLLTVLPGIGTPLAEMLMPVDERTEQVWEQLPPDVRASLMGDSMWTTMMTDVWASFPIFSGAGMVASALKAGAKGGNFMQWAATAGRVKPYAPGIAGTEMATNVRAGWAVGRALTNTAAEVVYSLAGRYPAAATAVGNTVSGSLRGMNLAMAAGVSAMTANWALSTFSDEYFEEIGQYVDANRPISESSVAGLLNNIGYFSSATFGAWTATKVAAKVPGAIGGKAAPSVFGAAENRMFSSVMGGARSVRSATSMFTRAGEAVPDAMYETPVKSTLWDQLMNRALGVVEARANRLYDQLKAEGVEQAVAVERVNDMLRNARREIGANTVSLGHLLMVARKGVGLIGEIKMTDEARNIQSIVNKNGRELEDQMAAILGLKYNEATWQRRMRNVGITPKVNMAESYREWIRSYARRRGLDLDEAKLLAEYGDDADNLRKFSNLLLAEEYHAAAAELKAAGEVMVEGHKVNPADYFIMRYDHLFQDQADHLMAAIDQRGTPGALLGEEELQTIVGRLIRNTQELDAWWARQTKTGEGVDLDALLKFMQESYSTFPGRHPVNVTGETANLPINALARRLAKEGMFTVAYKPKGSVLAYQPTAREMAVRVSRNAPDGYRLEPPPEYAGRVPGASGQFVVVSDVDAVLNEGLRARNELMAGVGERPVYHGTGNAPPGMQRWYVFDDARASLESLVGKGLYTTGDAGLANEYARGGGAVKEFRIAADARLFDAEAPIPDEVIDALRADMAKGRQGRFWYWADQVRAESGDMIDPDALISPQTPATWMDGNWYDALERLAIPPPGPGGVPGTRATYYDAIVDGAIAVRTSNHFKNAVNEVLREAGWDGLTHTGGRRMGGRSHPVTVLFDPENMMQRAKVIGTGIGSEAADGNLVSMYLHPERAGVVRVRFELAVRASRGEATVEEIIDHFEQAYSATDGVRRGALDAVDEMSGVLRNKDLDWVGNSRDDLVQAAKFYYDPAVTGPPSINKYPAKLGELVQDLDRGLHDARGNAGVVPLDDSGAFVYAPSHWAGYSVDIQTPPNRLAMIDPAKISTVRVAMRTETPLVVDQVPRLTFDTDLLHLDQGAWDRVMGTMRKDEWAYRFVSSEDELARLINDGIDPQHSLMFQSATDLDSAMPVPDFMGKDGVVRVRVENLPQFERRIPAQHLEVLKPDGTWQRLGAVDRLPFEPVPRETMDSWIGRRWQHVMSTNSPVPADLDDVADAFLQIETSAWQRAQGDGIIRPANSLNANIVYSMDDLMGGSITPIHDMTLLEIDRSAMDLYEHVLSAGMGSRTQWELRSAPVGAVKRVWSWSDDYGQYVLAAEPRRYGLGPTDFYVDGGEMSTLKSRSNHLWVVDDAAKAEHAGWRDSDPQPLDNQWEQPWNTLTEDPTLGAEPIYEHVSYVRLSDGTLVKAPWVDYPLNPAEIQLGNRTHLGQKFDSIFQGIRSWRMHEHQLAQAARIFGGRYGFTAAQIELFKDKVDMIARTEPWSGLGGGKVGQIRTTPYAVTKFRAEQVENVAHQIFGKGEVRNLVTGAMETPKYAKLLGDAYLQAYTLNLTSGITARMKNIDLFNIGPASTWVADWLIPTLRFKASPVFRVSELLESKVFNNMRGTHTTPQDRMRFAEAGMQPNNKLLAADFGQDPLLETLFREAPNQLPMSNAQVHGLDDMVEAAGTGPGASYALWREVDDLFTKKGVRDLLYDISDPAAYKNGLMYDMQIEVVKRELPGLIKRMDPSAYEVLSKQLKVPDDQMARFIVDDRIMWEAWQAGKIDFETLLAHGRKYTGPIDSPEVAAQMKAIYESEDWMALDVLMRSASRSAASEAFGVHFFGSYRSALERSINHPLLGIYPASWAYKAAKEWVRFLYDNRMFGQGQLRLGMYPAVAINQLIENINVAVAQNTDGNWEDWLNNGPARNWLFLWNLLLPGDWSSLPLPLARPLRTISRALIEGDYEKLLPWNLAADTLIGPQGRGGIGIIRDVNLAVRGIKDVYDYFAEDENGQWDNLAEGLTMGGQKSLPPDWDSLVELPVPFDFSYPSP